MEERHKEYFDAHPDVKRFHFTTDGMAFAKPNDARNHQLTLTGKPGEVETVDRPDPAADGLEAERIEALERDIAWGKEKLLEDLDEDTRAEREASLKKDEEELAKLKGE
ncbi:hypothetical protein FUAX_40860 (plasmid) [Fulvitalea axinellae]|uniref:Uncharacterized protein n=1 Tax=Fulvitalea axinellae TaxID=1182444 RepID=A0AAU9DIB0_9BACT|nr:hypothetical protein FUAX_33020 [Fulvitalea axinellae]BDD11654.1 hypothetical protein FUAX_40860 [Fulvitalea axinellae]